jgi:hypothetical protein
MPRPVQRIARGLLRVAEHSMVKFLRINPGPLDRSLGGNRAQLLRRKIFQLPAIAAKGRPRPTDDGDISRLQHDFPTDLLRAE